MTQKMLLFLLQLLLQLSQTTIFYIDQQSNSNSNTFSNLHDIFLFISEMNNTSSTEIKFLNNFNLNGTLHLKQDMTFSG